MEKKDSPKSTLRATAETQRQLKIIAALTGETMHAVLTRLIQAEYERLCKQEKVKDDA
jgi:prophage DNA circulation protein